MNRGLNQHVADELGMVGYALFDLASALNHFTEKSRISSMNKTPYIDFLNELRMNRTAPSTKRTRRKNVIFVQLESIDAVCLRNTFNGKEITPFLNSLIPRSHYFLNTLDHSGAGRTVDGELMALTSLLPLPSDPVYIRYDLQRTPSLPKTLKKEGYYSISIHGFSDAYWNRGNAHDALGFDKSLFIDKLEDTEQIGWGISDSSLLKQVVEIYKNETHPVFIHSILLTNHHPYGYVSDRFSLPTNNIYEDYIESVGYVDQCVENFFESLKEEDLLKDTIVAIYSDHDSSITQELVDFLDPEHRPVYLDSIPFLIYGLDAPPEIHEGLAGLQDLPVIILNDLRISIPHTFTGQSLGAVEQTISPAVGKVSLQNGTLKVEPVAIDLNDLTRASILDPQSLQKPL